MNLFTRDDVIAGTPEDALAAVAALIAVVLAVEIPKTVKRRADVAHDPLLAWMRGGVYFAACVVVAWATGVLSAVVRRAPVGGEQLSDVGWWALTVGCLGVIGIGYFGIWRRGTQTHGRPLDRKAVLVFGVTWGVTEGMLILSVWAAAEWLGADDLVASLVTFVVASAWLGGWHATYWDLKVAPEHNIVSWNLAKVLVAHVPNLAVTLTHLAIHENPALFVGFQTLAVGASAWFMHFPSWNAPPVAHRRIFDPDPAP